MVLAAFAFAAASAALGAANSLSQSKSAVNQLKQQAALKNLEADIYEKNAAMQANADAYNEDMSRKQRNLELSRQRVATAQSGLTGGTLIDVQLRSDMDAEIDQAMERYNNHSRYIATMYEAQKARNEASQYLANAKSVKKTSWLNALLSGASSGLSVANSGGLLNLLGVENMSGQGSGWNPATSAPARKPSR